MCTTMWDECMAWHGSRGFLHARQAVCFLGYGPLLTSLGEEYALSSYFPSNSLYQQGLSAECLEGFLSNQFAHSFMRVYSISFIHPFIHIQQYQDSYSHSPTKIITSCRNKQPRNKGNKPPCDEKRHSLKERGHYPVTGAGGCG